MAPENVTQIRPNSEVLVLNASYTPLNIVSWKRAIILLLKEKAAFVSAKVIRLVEYIQIPFAKINSLKPSRNLVHKRDGHKCQYCGSTRGLTIDHVIPRSKGGKDTWENMVTACGVCNTRKGDKMLADTGMRLARRPTAPPNRFVFAIATSRDDEWQQYNFI
jgi:5-methylcytosine-specific restriction endonuclease McrA